MNRSLFLKRCFDLALAGAGLLLSWPLFVVIAAWIKLDSRGPVFYRGLRVGRGGRAFRMLKFRTMVDRADRMGGSSTANDDPRITRAGKTLRKYKLDELPQLINVAAGDMSIVGPRPEVEPYVDMYTDEERVILDVKPGITDWATLWNSDEGSLLAGSADPERTYLERIRPQKVRLQLEYVRKGTFSTDVSIVCRTLAAVFLRMKPRSGLAAGKGMEGVCTPMGRS